MQSNGRRGTYANAILSREYRWRQSSAPVGPPSRTRVYNNAVANAENPFESDKPYGSIQIGVDPNTLIPTKDLSTLDPNRIQRAVQFAGDQAVKVTRNGTVLQGHHRIADAINKGRSVDVIIQ